MSAPQLLPRIQVLEAKVQAVQGQIATSSAATAPASSGSGGLGITWLSQALAVFNNIAEGAQGWTGFSSSQIPSSATSLIVQCQARRDDGVAPGYKGIYCRANVTGIVVTVLASNSQGTDTDTEGGTYQSFIPCSNGSFQFSIDNGLIGSTMLILGYI